MKFKKLILIFTLVLICSGCSNIKYSLKFNKNIEEYMIFNATDEAEEDEFDSMDSMPGMSETEYLFQSLPYNSGSDGQGNYYAGTYYDNIEDISDSIIFKYISRECLIIDGSKIQIKISSNDLTGVKNISNLEVTLYIPYYVSKHNADSVSNNTYKWVIDDFNNDEIIINFDMSKPADYMKKNITYIAIGVLVIGIICVIIYFVCKNKKANEI